MPGEFFPEAPGPGEIPPPPSPKIWSLRDLVFFLIFAAFALLLSSLLVPAGFVAVSFLAGRHEALEALQHNTYVLVLIQTVFYSLLLGYVYLLAAFHYRRPLGSALCWRKPTAARTFHFFLGGVALALAVQFAPTVLPDNPDFPLRQFFTSPGSAYAVAAFAILVAPFMEELIFRGVLFAVFERQVGLRFAIVATAILFGALHVPEYWSAWNHVLLIFLVGLAFSLARGLTGSLASSAILHLAYNASLVAGLFFQTNHFRAM